MTCVVRDRKPVADVAARAGAGAPKPVPEATTAAGVSPSLLAAALGGLLCLSACAADESAAKQGQEDAAAGGQKADASAAGEGADDAATAGPADASSGEDATDGESTDASAGGDAATGEPGGPRITLSQVDPSITEESFRMQCEELNGKIELHPSCGGANSCRGMSYDIDTHVYTEHTCKALNTCRGFSCVLPESA